MTRLPVDIEELCIALEADSSDLRWFLDLDTGDVILVTEEYDPAEHDGLSVQEVEADGNRFRRVPAGNPVESVGDMKAFAADIGDAQLKESLELALTAPRPDRRFRAVLGWLPEMQDRWHQFRLQRCRARAHAWLTSLGIEASSRAA